jgi:hypothetical protein
MIGDLLAKIVIMFIQIAHEVSKGQNTIKKIPSCTNPPYLYYFYLIKSN